MLNFAANVVGEAGKPCVSSKTSDTPLASKEQLPEDKCLTGSVRHYRERFRLPPLGYFLKISAIQRRYLSSASGKQPERPKSRVLRNIRSLWHQAFGLRIKVAKFELKRPKSPPNPHCRPTNSITTMVEKCPGMPHSIH